MATPYLALLLLPLLVVLAGCSRAAAQEEAAPEPVATEAMLRIAMAPHVGPVRQSRTQEAVVGEPVVFGDTGAEVERLLPARMVVPTLEMDIPVVEIGWSRMKDVGGSVYSAWDEADFAAGWHKNSAVPGEDGNIVLSGHNNVRGAVFRELDLLKRGDVIDVYVDDVLHEYVVDQILIVPERDASDEQRRSNAQFIEQTEREQLTLVSCWPRDNNTHRIIVIAYPAGE